jgi:hypothetical protein
MSPPTTITDHERVVTALRQLAPSIQTSSDRAWTREPAVRVIDCVLSLNRNYDSFVVPRLDRFEQHFPAVRSIGDLSAEIAKYPSAHEFVLHALRYNDQARAVILGRLVDWLVTIAGNGTPAEQLANVERWAREAPFTGYKALGIRGFALAGFQYLRMLFGANTTKPDKWICQWVAAAIGHSASPFQTLQLLERAAPEADVLLRDVDTTIWELSARGSHHGRTV